MRGGEGWAEARRPAMLRRRAHQHGGGGQDGEVVGTLDGVGLRSSDGSIHNGEHRRLGRAGRRRSARKQGLKRDARGSGGGETTLLLVRSPVAAACRGRRREVVEEAGVEAGTAGLQGRARSGRGGKGRSSSEVRRGGLVVLGSMEVNREGRWRLPFGWMGKKLSGSGQDPERIWNGGGEEE
uniref:Uncharacterized protein n=1 Tax=Triticum urartu TaxID=4572 RepID=A0A8R7PQR1_TRIUA